MKNLNVLKLAGLLYEATFDYPVKNYVQDRLPLGGLSGPIKTKDSGNYRNLEVTHDRGGHIYITGERRGEHGWDHYQREVDASNPLDDGDLVQFHKEWDGPSNIAYAVESAASQHRRIVSAEPKWGDLRK